ncbi:MAG TPA: TonB-dependent receptor plug domain-containing protein, partial [Bacteroidia bacterium]|nr:TonB-dependent receptor plug domain-containing protein [Bacteroidia bacterium]
MKKIILLITGIVCTCVAFSQTITVVDNVTQQTMPGVVVYSNNPNVSAVTNGKGQIDGSVFKTADSIFFKYLGYELTAYSYQQVEAMKFKVGLKENNISMGEVVISSNRWEESKIETPNRIEKINMKDAAFQNPQTTADLLGTSGYAYIQKSQLGGGSPMLRGMATNRVLLVVDGVRMNTAVFRAGNVQNVISLDANALESTEILFGPGSVMYGSDAIGGVMNFQTVQPRFSDSTNKILFSGNALMRTSTANSENTGHIDLN